MLSPVCLPILCCCWEQVKGAFNAEVQSRSELELFLRQCIDEVKADIQKRRRKLTSLGQSNSSLPPVRSSASRPSSRDGTTGYRLAPQGAGPSRPSSPLADMPLTSFSAEDRQKVMELLFAQERVVNLLYTKTFPDPSGHGISPAVQDTMPASAFGSNVQLSDVDSEAEEEKSGDHGQGGGELLTRLVALRDSGAGSAMPRAATSLQKRSAGEGRAGKFGRPDSAPLTARRR